MQRQDEQTNIRRYTKQISIQNVSSFPTLMDNCPKVWSLKLRLADLKGNITPSRAGFGFYLAWRSAAWSDPKAVKPKDYH